jgi:hypothetical protein
MDTLSALLDGMHHLFQGQKDSHDHEDGSGCSTG